jgi:hypothetical protein|tara:strand:+ start:112 stop:252 length:141 start_codon:yes stop_codon:yes gene_type:complete
LKSNRNGGLPQTLLDSESGRVLKIWLGENIEHKLSGMIDALHSFEG